MYIAHPEPVSLPPLIMSLSKEGFFGFSRVCQFEGVVAKNDLPRHCEERSDEAIQDNERVACF